MLIIFSLTGNKPHFSKKESTGRKMENVDDKANPGNNEAGNSEKPEKKIKFISSNGLLFQTGGDEKIKCGNCKKSFIRIISHLKNTCSGALSDSELEKFKQQMDKFNKNKRQIKWTEKAKSIPDKFRAKQKKIQDKWSDKAKSSPDEFRAKKKKKSR